MRLKNQVATWLTDCRRLAVLGIGNPFRGDDAVGIEVLKRLKGKVPENARLFECETVPENRLDEIESFQPSHVLMIDAAQLNVDPGGARLVLPEEFARTVLSTHAMPLFILAEVLRKSLNAKVMLLGVQPERVEFGENLSPKLRKASREIAQILMEAIRAVL